jgi:hypothetical protein
MNTCKHPERPVAARCVACGMVLCHECRVWEKKRNFCESCASGKPSGFRSPSFSMLLSLVPGLGQIYAGSFFRGLFFLAGAGSCAALHRELPPVLILFLWFFSIWDARVTALKRNHRVTRGRSGSPGAGDGDWMLFLGSAGLAGLFVGLPIFTGVTMETWTLWASFGVVLVLSALLGRGGKNVKEA